MNRAINNKDKHGSLYLNFTIKNYQSGIDAPNNKTGGEVTISDGQVTARIER